MSDKYGLGKCGSCNHFVHNHGLGMCLGNLLCQCEKFNGEGAKELAVRIQTEELIALIKGEQK